MSKAHDLAKSVNAILGAGTIKMGSDPSLRTVLIPTGVLPIDVLLSGGVPRNRITELFGPFSTLKSYIALSAIAQAQKQGGAAVLVDTEHSYDSEWAESIGVDTKSLILKQPETGEEAVDISEVLIRGGADIVVWDSVAATLPQQESTKRLHKENVQPARQAALMSLAMRKLTAANTTTALVFTNQTRINVGQTWGDPETTPGGRALPFYSSYRVHLRKAGTIKEVEDAHDAEQKVAKVNKVTGIKIKATLDKSKLSIPFSEVLFAFDLTTGHVDDIGFLISHGLDKGMVGHEGQQWWVDGEEAIRGKDAFRTWLEKNEAVRERMASVFLGVPTPDSKPVASGRSKRLVKKVAK